ncbi:hypothetical protein V8C42DRAFT_314712 [Trichoderma barbatum]
MAGCQMLLLPTAPCRSQLCRLAAVLFMLFSRRLQGTTTEQIPRTANLYYGARPSLAGVLTHGDVGGQGSVWLTSTLLLLKGSMYDKNALVRHRYPP